MTERKRILFLCTGNSARSQMAEGMMRAVAGDRYDIESAGTLASFVRPQAIVVMREIGIDISEHRSKCVDEFIGQRFDHVITVCDDANRSCPVFPGNAELIHWTFDDPADARGSELEVTAVFRRIRDEIGARLMGFLKR